MELTKENYNDWIKELDIKAEIYFGKDFSKTLSKNEWMDLEGHTVDEVIQEKLNQGI
jgi:hypothetical protein